MLADNFYRNFAILSSILIGNVLGHNICPTEYSNGGAAKWQPQGAENELVISNPGCLNEANNLITRICINGTWLPQTTPICHSITREDRPCPDDFHYIDDYCVQVTHSQMQGNHSLGQMQNQTDKSRYFWLPVRRVVKYGPFEYTDIGENYGQTFKLKDSEGFYQNDCLILDTKSGMVQTENCSKSYELVRYFPRNIITYSCPSGCVPSFNNTCFCKRTTCKNLAKIRTVAQKEALQLLIDENDTCGIGETYNWSLELYLTKNAIQYGDPSKINCAICERSVPDHDDPKLVLSFEEAERKLYLLVYSPDGIAIIKQKPTVYCFSNAVDDNFKTKLKIEQIFDRHDEETPTFSLLVYKVKLLKFMGEYWCEAFTLQQTLKKSNKIIAFQRKRGNEYSLRLLIPDVCKSFTCDWSEIISYLRETKLKMLFQRFNAEIRLMEIFKIGMENDILDILFHVSTGNNEPVESEYGKCLLVLQSLTSVEVIYFKSSEYCLSETTTWGGKNLTWAKTKINSVIIPKELCIMEDETPVTRLCTGTFMYGADWGNISGQCANVTISQTTIELSEFATSNETSLQSVWIQIRDTSFNILDLYYINILLENFGRNDSLFASNIMNKLIQTDRSVLKRSQVLNLTDVILDEIDDLFSNLSTDPEAVYIVRRNNFLVHVTNPFLSNISGLLLYNTSDNFPTFQLVDYQRNHTFDSVDKQNLVLAVHVPELILDQILNETETNISEVFVVTVIFSNDNLFIDNTYHSDGYVISVTIPSFGSYLQTPISVIFKSNEDNFNGDVCGFWDHGKKSNQKTGEWSVLGSSHVKMNETDLHQCSFVHLTHFALLLMSDRIQNNEENVVTVVDFEQTNEIGFEVITIIGTILSAAGIVGIFLTAVFFRRWRSKLGTKILLNLSVVIFLEIICIQLSEIRSVREAEYECKIVGMLLHYLVLSQFCWMLIYAYLQYYRFVKVIGAVPNNLFLNSVIFGWGAPLVLVFIVGLTSTQSYVSKSYELCYPRGMLLHLTVIMPICVVVLANIIIFGLIMYNITFSKTSDAGKKMFKLRLYLAILLFSVLGIPWVFGLLALLTPVSLLKVVLFYMFCTTATLQGFVLFLFYVVLNKETRQFWLNHFKMIKC